MQTSQEYFTTTVYANFGGQTEWIMGNWKIENWGETRKYNGTLLDLIALEISVALIKNY